MRILDWHAYTEDDVTEDEPMGRNSARWDDDTA